MTFGRPMMISKSCNVSLPLDIDDDYLLEDGEGRQPPGVPSHMGLYICSTRLYDILADILSTFYAGSPENEETKGFSLEILLRTLKLNRRLDEFLETIPDYLRPRTDLTSAVMFRSESIQLQQQVLSCRLVQLSSNQFLVFG